MDTIYPIDMLHGVYALSGLYLLMGGSLAMGLWLRDRQQDAPPYTLGEWGLLALVVVGWPLVVLAVWVLGCLLRRHRLPGVDELED